VRWKRSFSPVCRSVEAGLATFLIKVKSHRGEPIIERADDVADELRRDADEVTAGTVQTEGMGLQMGGGASTPAMSLYRVWTNGVGDWMMEQAGEGVLHRTWEVAAKRGAECVWRRRGEA
jgi:hypothetical protein